jgi:hypothetical protein
VTAADVIILVAGRDRHHTESAGNGVWACERAAHHVYCQWLSLGSLAQRAASLTPVIGAA